MNKKYSKRFGFTLTEVLVTLAIIGVVSALTVPTLMNSYQKQAYIVQLHKVHNDLSQGLDLLLTEEAKLSLTQTTLRTGTVNADTTGRFLKTYFKIVNDCATTPTPCFAPTYRSINTATDTAFTCSGYTVTLTNGAAVCMSVPRVLTDPILTVVDTNGTKPPNIAGRDLFSFYIFNDGSIDEETLTPLCRSNGSGAPATCSDTRAMRQAIFTSNCLTTPIRGTGCFGKVLNDNWDITY